MDHVHSKCNIEYINPIVGYVLILHTNKDEGEEYLLYSYPESSGRLKYFESLKGVFLACGGVTNTILGEPTKNIHIQNGW